MDIKKQRIILYLVLTSLSLTLKAQNLKTYSGSFKVGFGLDGDGKATYTYYEDKNTLERIKQGAFKYTLNQKNDIAGSFNKIVTGSYVHGLKNGTWTYNLNYVDFNRTEGDDNLEAEAQVNVNATGNVSLSAPYLNGLPNGIWEYKKKIIYRDKRYFMGKLYVTPYKLLSEINISVSFNNGVFSGPISIKNTNYSISGTFDSKGNLDGQWTVQTKSNQEITNYKHGLVMSRVNRSLPNGEILEKEIDETAIHKIKEDYTNGVVGEKDIELLGYTVSKRNVFSEKSIRLTNTLFNDLDFMYSSLLGDRMINIDKENYTINGIAYKGGDFYKLSKAEYRDLKNDISMGNASSALIRSEQEITSNPVRAIADLNIARINFVNALHSGSDQTTLKSRNTDTVSINADITKTDNLILNAANKFTIWNKDVKALNEVFKMILSSSDKATVNSILAKELKYSPFSGEQHINNESSGTVYYPSCCTDQYRYFQSEFQFGKLQVDFRNNQPFTIHYFISSGDYGNVATFSAYFKKLAKAGFDLVFQGFQATDGSGHITYDEYDKLSESDRQKYAPITVFRNDDLICRFYNFQILFISKNG